MVPGILARYFTCVNPRRTSYIAMLTFKFENNPTEFDKYREEESLRRGINSDKRFVPGTIYAADSFSAWQSPELTSHQPRRQYLRRLRPISYP